MIDSEEGSGLIDGQLRYEMSLPKKTSKTKKTSKVSGIEPSPTTNAPRSTSTYASSSTWRATTLVGSSAEAFEFSNGYSYKRLRVWIQWVTPELAAEWLKTSAPNRHLRPRRIESIGRDMCAKKYMFTGVPIIFDDGKELIDGQHRLRGCLAAREKNPSFQGFFSTIVMGVRRDRAMDGIDDVSVRTMGDRFRIQLKIENANACAAVALLLCQFANADRSSSWRKFSYSEVKASLLKNRAEIEWAVGAIGARIEPGISSGGAPILAAFAFARPANPALIDQAAGIFRSGEVPSDDHPMRKLRSTVAVDGPRIGNKNQSSQFSRHALSLVALGFLERILIGSKKRGLPKPDVEVIARISILRTKARKP